MKVVGFLDEVGNPQDDAQIYVGNEYMEKLSFGVLNSKISVSTERKMRGELKNVNYNALSFNLGLNYKIKKIVGMTNGSFKRSYYFNRDENIGNRHRGDKEYSLKQSFLYPVSGKMAFQGYAKYTKTFSNIPPYAYEKWNVGVDYMLRISK